MQLRNISTLIFFLVVSLFKSQTNISGVVNAYTSVSAINTSTLTVASSAAFAVGNRVLLIQMKGATIDITNTSSYGTISALNNAGNFQFGIVSTIPNGTSIVLATTPTVAFTAGGTNRVQLVRVRSIVGNGNVNGNITATAWNGTSGGVIAIEVSGTLTIAAGFRIDGTGSGFRGGLVSGQSDGTAWCNWSDFRSTDITVNCYDGIYAQKGEGIAEDSPNDYGRGPQANGGGGSGEHNGGGGGGSNVSVGGDGGMQFSGCPYRRNGTGINCNTPAGGALQVSACTATAVATTTGVMVGGIGGKALTGGSTNNKIFMGGGGGGGQQNGAGGTSGAIGGGIVIISATTIVNNSGNADAIRSNGNAAANTTGNEGAGGGGGGALLVETNTFANAITLTARGGNGGNAVTSNVSCRGPGGGGGGGLIWISGLTSTPTNLSTNVLTGSSGSVTCSNAAVCGGTPPATNTLDCHGNTLYCASTPTSNGTVNTSLNIPLPVELIDFSSHCSSNMTQLNWKVASEKNMAYYTVQRSNNATDWTDVNTISIIEGGVYPKYYSLSDPLMSKSDLCYYRLKYVHTNDIIEFSQIITSNCKSRTDLDFIAYYNNGFILEFQTIPQRMLIINALGQIIHETKPHQNSPKSYYVPVETELPTGIYIINCEYPDQMVSKKIIVNK